MSAFLTPLFLILGITYLFNEWMQLITVEKKFWDTEWWKMRLEEVQRPFLEALIHYPVLLCLVAQLCLTFWDPVDCRQPGSSVHGDSPGKSTGVGCHALLLQGIFPTQGSNPGLPHCRQIPLPTEPSGKPKNTGVGSLSLLQGIFLTQESKWDLLHCKQILYQLSCQGSPGP